MNVISNQQPIEDVVNTFQHPIQRTALKVHNVLLTSAVTVAIPFRWLLEQLDGINMYRDWLQTKSSK